MSSLIVALNIAFIIFITYFFRERGQLAIIYWIGLTLKIIAGISVGLIYLYYYGVGDTIYFASDAKVLTQLAANNFPEYLQFLMNENAQPEILNSLVSQEYRSLLMVKIVSAFSLISADNYWVIATYLSVISFYGAWYFVRAIEKHFPTILFPAIFSFLFFPSVVFWSSGLIKESLALGALFFLSGIVVKLWFHARLNWIEILITMLSCWLSWKLKYYYAGVFFLVAFMALIYKLGVAKWMERNSLLARAIVAVSIFSAALFVATNAHPNFRTSKILAVVADNYNAFVSYSDPEDLIQFSHLSPTISSMIEHAPKAIISGLYRPFIWEASNIFQLIVSIENLLLLILTVFMVFSFRGYVKGTQWLLCGSVMLYVFMLVTFITLSTPNFGTLSRYRISFLPYFVLLLSASPATSVILQKTMNYLVRDKQ